MARLDNKSTAQPINMFTTPDITASIFDGGGTAISKVLDTANFDGGYTIVINNSDFLDPGATYRIIIQTSATSSSGFVNVPNNELIGGDNLIVTTNLFQPRNGTVSFSRGVLSTLQFVRLVFDNDANVGGIAVSASLDGRSEVAPPTTPEGTEVNV